MALFAKDQGGTISAWDATRGKLYQCLECQTPLKLRRSSQKFPHFYHLKATKTCRLHSKSEKHLLIQLQLQKQIPEAILEKPFPSIQRIADVVWEEKRIIFEVQCSFIAEKEAQERTREYGAHGYEVVWILYDGRFNRRKVGAAENWMRSQSCYFADKNLVFYDQLETIQHQKRTQRGPKIPIRLSPLPLYEKVPEQLRCRSKNKYYFENDALDLSLRNQIIFLPKPKKNIGKYLQKKMGDLYAKLLNYLLKIDCRS